MTASHITRFILLLLAFAHSSCGTIPQQKDCRGCGIHQVGLVWLKNAGSQEDQKKIIDAVHAFGREIPDVKQALVGPSDGIGGPFSDTSYDLCFILTFKDEAARQRYNQHTVHVKAAQEVFLPLSKKLLFYRFTAQ